jgi:hypothetical protein
MQVINHKVYLYKPDGSSSSFLGELIVDNLKVDLKLQDISSISFRIPEVINGEVNPRIDEVLDSYIVELWYGRIDGVYENGDFEKVRFRIYSTPLEFAEYKYLHSYSGYSIESDLEFKQIVSWPGIEVKDFFRTLKYNNNASTPAFTEPGFSYTVLLSTNTSQTKYIKILPTDQPSALDIFIYEKRINTADDSESEVSLIELTSGGVNSNDFKAGYYYLTTFNGIVTEIYIAIPDNVTLFNGQNTSTRIFSYRLYDNPVSRKFAVGVKTNTEEPLSNMYIDLAQDAATGDDTPEYGGYTFNTQATYSKNGLKLQEILQGIDNEEDGILYNTGFTLDTISNTINAKYRSNIDFNNITVYQAIKEVAESFDAIAVFNTINKTVSFYAENEFGTNSGLFIKYATYLKSINKEIDAAKIITNARATGKDNIKISLLNPTGSEVWEDYSYFLDGFLITDTEGFTINQNIDIGLSITYPTTTGLQSRWMDATEALKIAKWQFTRDYFHGVLSDKDADVYGILHEPFRGLYEERSKLINLYVKYETQYERKKASEYKFYYLSEHYKNLYQSRGTNLNEYQYYLAKYNESKQQAQDFKNTVLNVTYNNLYNEQQSGTVAFRLAIVRDYLDKAAWAIDLEKLRTFQRETTHNDSKIDNEYDLLTATKIFVDENKQPRITFNISIIDVLEAAEAYQDWDKFNVGDKIYIFFPEFNIDLEAQIREVSIDFQGKSLSIVVSTVRNYNRSFGNFLTKSIRRFHNANMNTLMYYKDANEVTIEDTNNFRTTFEDGIDAGSTSFSTGAVDDSTGESSTTTDGEGQKSKIVTGVDIYTEALTLSEFTTGVKITDGRVLTFKPYDVGGEQWVQEVEISADNGFVIRQVFSDGPTIDVRRLAYIDSDDGSAYFAGWKLDPGQFKSGAGSNFVAINSQPVGTNPYAFWSGNLVPSLAPFSIKKDGTIIAEKGLIAGLTIAKDLVNPNLIKFYAGDGNFHNANTPFYLDNGGNFSLSNKLKFDISTQTLSINGTIVATAGSIGGWTIEENQLSSGLNNTYVALNANSLSDYAFWAGNSNPANAPFSVTKTGNITANSGFISKLNIGTAYKNASDKTNNFNPKNAIFKRVGGGAGVWGEDETAFYLDEDGRFSLSDELTWNPETDTFFVNGTFIATTGFIGGFKITDNTIQQGDDTTKFVIYSDDDTPFISIAQATNVYNQNGIFLGITSDGEAIPSYIPRFSIKSNTNSLTFDGTNLSVTGSLTGSTGIFGGAANSLYKVYLGDNTTPLEIKNNTTTRMSVGSDGAITLGALSIDNLGASSFSGSLAIGSGNTIFKADTNGIYLGNASFASAPFSVTPAGVLKATSGTIGGVSIDDDRLYTGDGEFEDAATAFYLDTDGQFSLGTKFVWDGTDLTIDGEINATTGEIGGWNIGADNLNSAGFKLKSSETAPYLSIGQVTEGFSQDGVFLGLVSDGEPSPTFIPKLSLVGSTSALEFDGNSLSITGGSLTVGENFGDEVVKTGSIEITENGIYGYYGGNLNPSFALDNSTGQLNAVDIFLKAGEKTAEIGNLTGSLAGDFGLEITNNGGFYLDKTDISFNSTTKRISSTATDLSVYKKGNKISVTDSLNNNGVFTVKFDGVTVLDIEENILGYYVEVEEDLTNESAGAQLNIQRTKPFKVSVTDEGFYILTVDSLEDTDTAMSVRYDNNRIWAKRLLIADVEDEEGATVVIGTIAANDILETPETYGIIAKNTTTVEIEGQQVERTNITYMTAEGFKIVQNGQITFIVNPEGNITAKTLFIEGNSRLAGWLVQDDHFRSANYNYSTYTGETEPTSPVEGETWFDGTDYKTFTSGVWVITTQPVFSTSGIRFNNNGTIIAKQFAIDSTGDAFFRGDLTAASGTFGATNAGHVILGNADNPLQVKNNTNIILDLEDDGTLKFAGFTADSSSLKAGTTAGNFFGISTGAGTNDDISFWAGATSNTQNNISAALFRVKTDGSLVATNANISGAVNASSGSFTNTVTVGSGTTAGKIEVGTALQKIVIDGTNSAASTAIYSGTGGFGDATMKFFVNAEGKFSLGDQLTWDPAANSGNGQLIILGDIEADTGTVGGWSVDANTLTSGTFVINSDFSNIGVKKPYISINQSTTPGYNNDGIFLGIHSEGISPVVYTPRFSIKNGSNGLFWDGTNLTINGGGTFTGSLSIGTDNSIFKADTQGIYLGHADFSSAPFRVSAAGAIRSTSGEIAGWTIGANTLSKNDVTLDSSGAISVGTGNTIFKADPNGIYVGNATFASAPFRVNQEGALTATSGKIANWTLGNTSLTAGTGGNSVGVTTDSIAFYAGNATPGSAPFRVENNGALTATSATISGTVNANAGNFTSTVTVGSGTTDGKLKIGRGTNANSIFLDGTNSNTTTAIYSGTTGFGSAGSGFYMDASGRFSLGNKLSWNGTVLTIDGGGSFSGGLVAATGTFGAVSIASGGSLTVGTNISINNTDGIKGTNGTSTAFQLSPNGTGSIGGFSYGLSSITSSNLILSSGSAPYLSLGQGSSNFYGSEGIFLGMVGSPPNNSPKFSMVTDSGSTFLKYDPNATFDLEIGGNAKIGPLNIYNINQTGTQGIFFNSNSFSGIVTQSSPSILGSEINSNSFALSSITTFSVPYSSQYISGNNVSASIIAYLYNGSTIINSISVSFNPSSNGTAFFNFNGSVGTNIRLRFLISYAGQDSGIAASVSTLQVTLTTSNPVFKLNSVDIYNSNSIFSPNIYATNSYFNGINIGSNTFTALSNLGIRINTPNPIIEVVKSNDITSFQRYYLLPTINQHQSASSNTTSQDGSYSIINALTTSPGIGKYKFEFFGFYQTSVTGFGLKLAVTLANGGGFINSFARAKYNINTDTTTESVGIMNSTLSTTASNNQAIFPNAAAANTSFPFSVTGYITITSLTSSISLGMNFGKSNNTGGTLTVFSSNLLLTRLND